MNMYIPVDVKKRDQAVFRAEELLRNTDWLKGILAYTLIGTMTNACPIEEIRTAVEKEGQRKACGVCWRIPAQGRILYV